MLCKTAGGRCFCTTVFPCMLINAGSCLCTQCIAFTDAVDVCILESCLCDVCTHYINHHWCSAVEMHQWQLLNLTCSFMSFLIFFQVFYIYYADFMVISQLRQCCLCILFFFSPVMHLSLFGLFVIDVIHMCQFIIWDFQSHHSCHQSLRGGLAILAFRQ